VSLLRGFGHEMRTTYVFGMLGTLISHPTDAKPSWSARYRVRMWSSSIGYFIDVLCLSTPSRRTPNIFAISSCVITSSLPVNRSMLRSNHRHMAFRYVLVSETSDFVLLEEARGSILH
jgi:hypothetical protein